MAKDPTEKARAIREQRAEYLTALQEGQASLREALLMPPACLDGASIYLVLCSARGMGPKTAKKVCLEASVWPLGTVGALSRHQHALDRVLEALPERIT